MKRLDVGTGRLTGRVNKPNRKAGDLFYHRVVEGDQLLIPTRCIHHLEGHDRQQECNGQEEPGQFLVSNRIHTLSIVCRRFYFNNEVDVNLSRHLGL
jgi:hypothetical protein